MSNRNVLKELNILGVVMVYREGKFCKPIIEWMIKFCDRILIQLDNWDDNTEKIIFSYKDNYPDKITVIYSQEPIGEKTNFTQGHPKRRFKLNQHRIREQVIKEIHELNREKKVDLIIWPDSDEIFVDSFPEILEDFWKSDYRWIMSGFVNVFNKMDVLTYNKMALHGRVFKYDEKMTALPYLSRTRYFPFCQERAYKKRNLIIHLCYLDEERRNFRQYMDNTPWLQEAQDYPVWQLPKPANKMTPEELADYQPGAHGRPSKYPSITLKEFLEKNNNKLN